MAKQKITTRKRSGIRKRGAIYHLDKWYKGTYITGSTGTSDRELAERILDAKIKEINDAKHFGYSKHYLVQDAFQKRINTATHKALSDTARALKRWLPYVGEVELRKIHTDHPMVQKFIKDRIEKDKVRNSTINRDIAELNTVLKLSATDWRDQLTGIPMLPQMPGVIRKLPTVAKNSKFRGKESLKPYVLTWEEQGRLLSHMSTTWQRLTLFALNTGARDQEICKLRWDNLRVIKREGKDDIYVFFIGAESHKGGSTGKDKFVFTNSVSRSIVDLQKGIDPEWVFPSPHSVASRSKAERENKPIPTGYPVHEITSNKWYYAWEKAKLPDHTQGFLKGCHNLRHTCATRLRHAKVGNEDRKDILGHESDDVTTHYSNGEIVHLTECLELITKKTDAVFLRRVV